MKPFVRSLLQRRGIFGGQVVTGVLLAVFLAGGTTASGNSGKNKNDASESASPSPGASASPAAPKFNVPIAVGHGALVLKLPYYDGRGRLQMYFNIQKAFRVDLDHLELKNAYMQTYDEKEAPDANVFMTRSVLDLDTRIVTSEVPVIVRRSDFQIVGQKMVFNTQTRAGRMTGHVRMVIYNRQEMARATPTPGPSGGATPQQAQPGATPQ